MIKIDISQILKFIGKDDIKALEPEIQESILKLENGNGAGNDFIGRDGGKDSDLRFAYQDL